MRAVYLWAVFLCAVLVYVCVCIYIRLYIYTFVYVCCCSVPCLYACMCLRACECTCALGCVSSNVTAVSFAPTGKYDVIKFKESQRMTNEHAIVEL